MRSRSGQTEKLAHRIAAVFRHRLVACRIVGEVRGVVSFVGGRRGECGSSEQGLEAGHFVFVGGRDQVGGHRLSFDSIVDMMEILFFKWANPGLFYRLFSVFLNKHHNNFYSK